MCTSVAPASRRLTTRARAVVPADDRIVYNHDAFSGNHFLDQIQLYAHVEIPDELTRLQKCPPI